MNAQEMRPDTSAREMAMRLRIDETLERRRKSGYGLAQQTGMTEAAVWRLRHGKTSAIRFESLEAICPALDCTPGDLLVIAKGEPKSQRGK